MKKLILSLMMLVVSFGANSGWLDDDKNVTIEDIKYGLMEVSNKKICLYDEVDGFKEFTYFGNGTNRNRSFGISPNGRDCKLDSVEDAKKYVNIGQDSSTKAYGLRDALVGVAIENHLLDANLNYDSLK